MTPLEIIGVAALVIIGLLALVVIFFFVDYVLSGF